MLKTVQRAMGFLSRAEKVKFALLLILRALMALFDLLGIMGIGLLSASIGIFLVEGSDPTRTFQLGPFSIPAISAATLPVFAGIILALFISKALASLALTFWLARFLARIEARAGGAIARSSFGRGLEAARQNSRDDVVFAVQVGAPSAFGSILNSIGTLAAEGFLFALVLTSFFFVDPFAAFAALAFFGVIAFAIQLLLGRVMERNTKIATQSTIEANSILGDIWEILREAQVLGRQDYFFKRIQDSRLQVSLRNAKNHLLSSSPRYIVETSLLVAIGIFIVFLSLRGDIVSSAVILGVFLTGGLRLMASMLPMQSALLTIKQSTVTANQALDLLERSSSMGTRLNRPLARGTKGSGIPSQITLESVSFSYQGQTKPAIRDISLVISPGSQVAFIGHSGSGKSTLAELILGVLRPTSGHVFVGDSIACENRTSSQNSMAYVPQKPGLISGTIQDNIALAEEPSDVDEARLRQAIKDSHLEGFINSLPEGVHTKVGNRKDEFSGGQIQRIGLARALYSQPSVLVLDEATSSLDAESENEIGKALDQLRGKVTVVLFAHRLNTVQKSDVVYLVEDGRISDSGSFQNLLISSAQVRKLAQLMSLSTEN